MRRVRLALDGRVALVGQATVLIAVKDAVLADSLRFSLELEGYLPKLCQLPLNPGESVEPRACLLLDQDVFTSMLRNGDGKVIGRLGYPTVLMVNQHTRLLSEQAETAGIATVVEKPLLGGILFDTIRMVLETKSSLGKE
jgi:hypothetical protein